MKKTKLLTTLVFIALLFIGLVALTGCEADKPKIETETLNYDPGQYAKYTVSVDVPKDKGYNFIKGDAKDVKYTDGYADYTLMGDKVRIAFKYDSYVYQTSIYYTGDKENTNFANFKAATYKEGSYEDTTIGGREAARIDYRYGIGSGELKGYRYTINIDDITTKNCMRITIWPIEEDTANIAELINDPEVQTIINSIKVEKK